MSASPNIARTTIVGTYLNLGYSLLRDTDYQVVMQEAGLPGAVDALLGPGTNYRITFTLLPQDTRTRVVADGALVSRAGTAFERAIETNLGAPATRVQFILDQIAVGLAAQKPADRVAVEAASAAKAKFSSYYANAPG